MVGLRSSVVGGFGLVWGVELGKGEEFEVRGIGGRERNIPPSPEKGSMIWIVVEVVAAVGVYMVRRREVETIGMDSVCSSLVELSGKVAPILGDDRLNLHASSLRHRGSSRYKSEGRTMAKSTRV